MKKINLLFIIALILPFLLGSGINSVSAATSPSLGNAAYYGVLADTYTNTSAGTTINGSVGFTTGPAVVPGGTHTYYGPGAPYAAAGADQATALSALNSQACTFTFASGAIDLATDTTLRPDPVGVYSPGVYCIDGAASIGTAGIILRGSGTYIFRMTGALNTIDNSIMTLEDGASACDIFWTPGAATTLGANSTFIGTNIDDSGITLGNNVNWTGQALAFGGTVTTDSNDTITLPVCAITNNDDPLVVPDPVIGGGSSIIIPRIQPIISITKTALPSILTNGPATATYTYNVSNPGTVDMRDIKVSDDKCSNVVFVSGDSNDNNLLETNETWTFRCSSYLNQTTTNIATVIGYDYGGLSATDSASATVIVRGAAIITPIIATTTPVIDTTTPITAATTTPIVPGLPNTGSGGAGPINSSWYFVIAISAISSLFVLYLAKQRSN